MSAAEQLHQDDDFDVAGAADYLGRKITGVPWTKQHLYNLLSSRQGPRCVKTRGRLRFKRADLDLWVRENSEARPAYSR